MIALSMNGYLGNLIHLHVTRFKIINGTWHEIVYKLLDLLGK